jgi:hypothetical protein
MARWRDGKMASLKNKQSIRTHIFRLMCVLSLGCFLMVPQLHSLQIFPATTTTDPPPFYAKVPESNTTTKYKTIHSDSKEQSDQSDQLDVVISSQFSVINQSQQVASSTSQQQTHLSPAHINECWRRCDQRINRIVYLRRGNSGLYDRNYVIRELSQLAGFLCAKLVFSLPAEMLSPKHNQGKRISKTSKWTDYYNVTFKQDNSPTVEDLTPFHRNSTNFKGWRQFSTRLADQAAQDFQNVSLSSWARKKGTKGFIWKINADFYGLSMWKMQQLWTNPKPQEGMHGFRKSMLPKVFGNQKDGCDYLNRDTIPSHIKLVMHGIWEDVTNISIANSTIGFFHIRRGDAKHECDTTLEKMQRFITCSFNGTESKIGNITLLFASDEQDPGYLKAIKDMAEDLGHVKVINVDELVLKHVQGAVADRRLPERMINNFFVFRIQDLLKWTYSSFSIEQRRTVACSDCIRLADWKKLWK